jgi:hypothetical protein
VPVEQQAHQILVHLHLLIEVVVVEPLEVLVTLVELVVVVKYKSVTLVLLEQQVDK